MIRPNLVLHRADGIVPLELVEMVGEFKDGYHHWQADTQLESRDRLQGGNMARGTVVHFGNGFLVCPHPADGAVAVFRSEPVS